MGNGRLTINLGALVANWKKLARLASGAKTGAVVKANAYGLGIEPVVEALGKAGCKTFFVATFNEGMRVRKINKAARIFVFNGFFPEAWEKYRKAKLIPVLCSPKNIKDFVALGSARGPCALHIDTGMNRLGLSAGELNSLVENDGLMAQVKPVMLMSHLACADDPGHRLNKKQIAAFAMASLKFPGVERSLSNSAGIFLGKKYHYDLTRPGVALYGGEAVNDVPNAMKPVVKLETRILQLRHAKKGESVGYGAAQRLVRDSVIATCGTGYADGFHRAASGVGVAIRRQKDIAGAFGMIGKHRVPILGRISMDLTTFDVTDVPARTLTKTEWIELLGKTINVDDLARTAGTIGYEILTSLGNRYARVYVSK